MNATQKRQDAISATRGQLRHTGTEPKTANPYEIESAVSEVRPKWHQTASDNQWKMFLREFKKWQRS